jgi:hypothetical protein
MTCAPRKQSKTYKVPKRPYEAARLDAELKVGHASWDYGLWRGQAESDTDQRDVFGLWLAGWQEWNGWQRSRTDAYNGTRRPDVRLCFIHHTPRHTRTKLTYSSLESTDSETSERSGEFS